MNRELDDLAIEISHCRACDRKKIPVEHVGPMRRGKGNWGMIIGVEPGQKEVCSAEAFSGLAGRRLTEWMITAGVANSRGDLLEKFYLTSLLKCRVLDKKRYAEAAKTCLPFLQRQLGIVQPQVVITLGAEPLKFLFGFKAKLETVVGSSYLEADFAQTLFPILPAGIPVVPLPHPSPLSRWTNNPDRKLQLQQALSLISVLHRGRNS